MSEKVSLTAEQLAPIVHEALAGLIKSMNESGAPPLVIAGELLKLGAEWFIQEEGKLAAQQNVRKLLHQYFEESLTNARRRFAAGAARSIIDAANVPATWLLAVREPFSHRLAANAFPLGRIAPALRSPPII
jgi:hypothetical protein